MQPTPAPSSPPRSPAPQDDHSANVANPPPQNNGSVPFSVLVGLFVKLQTEKKPERRRQYLSSWFTVCAQSELRVATLFNGLNAALAGAKWI
jgi:DNA ligase-4